MLRLVLLLLSVALLLPEPVARAQPKAPQDLATMEQAPSPLGLSFPSLGPLPDPLLPPGLGDVSAQGCAACHRVLHKEWAGSAHARSFTDPIFSFAWQEAGSPNSCLDCHAPLMAQRSDAPTTYINGDPDAERSQPNPGYRPLLRNEGVTCAACHLRKGTVLGPRAVSPEDSPHPVTESADLRNPDRSCAPCHQLPPAQAGGAPLLYDTVGEWRRSPHGRVGIPCNDCHMPIKAGEIASGRPGAYGGHSFPGPSLLASALSLDLRLDSPWYNRGQSGLATLTLMNTGAGHSIPTGDPYHQVRVSLRLEGLEGVNAKPATLLLARPLSRERLRTPDSENPPNNRLAPSLENPPNNRLAPSLENPPNNRLAPSLDNRLDNRLAPTQVRDLTLEFTSKIKMLPGMATLFVEVWYEPIAPDALPKDAPEELMEAAKAVLVRSEKVLVEFR